MFELFTALICQVSFTIGTSTSIDCPLPITKGAALDLELNAPSALSDYEPFEILVTPKNLTRAESFQVTVDDPDNAILWLEIESNKIFGRAPFTYEDIEIKFSVSVTSSTGRSATKSMTIPVALKPVSNQFNTSDGLFDFNPDEEIQQKLQNENYAVWDIMPMLRMENKTTPEGTYCYPRPDDRSYNGASTPPGSSPVTYWGAILTEMAIKT